jgi:peptidoglycan hydrolase FlgJ
VPSPISSSPELASLAAPVDARSVLDIQGLDSLRAAADAKRPEAIAQVAREFESLFLGMMLKSMRDAKLGDSYFDSHESEMYQDLYDQQLAQVLSQGKGLGIAAMITKALNPHDSAAAPAAAPGANANLAAPAARAMPPPAAAETAATTAVASAGAPASPETSPAIASDGAGASAAGSALAASVKEFVALVLPEAETAAEALGVSPLVLLAQAALESNWGRQVPAAEGVSSFNVFGIKAGARWTGRRVAKETVEYEGGVATFKREPFRAYDSLAHGFRDYVDLIQGHPRYAQALATGKDPARYASALQEAGYATDPAYAHKLNAVLSSDQLRDAVAALKRAAIAPIY